MNSYREAVNEVSLRRQIIEVFVVIFGTFNLLVKVFRTVVECGFGKIFPKPLEKVKGRIVVITGTGHGIGRELAYQYSKEGAIVVGIDVNGNANDETFKEIFERGYQKGQPYVCDIGNREKVLEVGEKIKNEIGDLDILINNAGIMPCHPLEKHSAEEIERIFKVNVFAHFWFLETFLPVMRKNNSGHIVAISSCAGILGIRNLVPYCASKFAVKGLMEALSEELRHLPNNNIKLTTVFPSMTDTGLCKKPIVRFKNAMKLLNPTKLAENIMQAQRKNIFQLTVPLFIDIMNNSSRLLPVEARFAFYDFFETYVASDLP